MIESLALSLLASLIGGLITYTIIKKITGNDRILEYVDVVLDGVTQDTELQKKVYLMGVLLGSGIKQGIGLTKGRGKFDMQRLIGMGLEWFFKGKQSSSEQLPSQPQTIEDLQKAFK